MSDNETEAWHEMVDDRDATIRELRSEVDRLQQIIQGPDSPIEMKVLRAHLSTAAKSGVLALTPIEARAVYGQVLFELGALRAEVERKEADFLVERTNAATINKSFLAERTRAEQAEAKLAVYLQDKIDAEWIIQNQGAKLAGVRSAVLELLEPRDGHPSSNWCRGYDEAMYQIRTALAAAQQGATASGDG